jgi:hypothetical protein
MLGPVAFLMLAPAAVDAAPVAKPAAYGPTVPVAPRKAVPRSPTASCASARAAAAATDVIVCAPPGFRIDPDVMAAHQAKRRGSRPTNPHESFKDHNCGTIGPMGCRGGATINVVQAAATAITMVQKAVKGENVGKMFVTDPQPSEYQLYLEARAAREAQEADAAARAKADAAAAAPAVR